MRLLGLPTLLSFPRPLFEASIIKSPKKDKSTTMGVEVPKGIKFHPWDEIFIPTGTQAGLRIIASEAGLRLVACFG